MKKYSMKELYALASFFRSKAVRLTKELDEVNLKHTSLNNKLFREIDKNVELIGKNNDLETQVEELIASSLRSSVTAKADKAHIAELENQLKINTEIVANLQNEIALLDPHSPHVTGETVLDEVKELALSPLYWSEDTVLTSEDLYAYIAQQVPLGCNPDTVKINLKAGHAAEINIGYSSCQFENEFADALGKYPRMELGLGNVSLIKAIQREKEFEISDKEKELILEIRKAKTIGKEKDKVVSGNDLFSVLSKFIEIPKFCTHLTINCDIDGLAQIKTEQYASSTFSIKEEKQQDVKLK